METFEDCKLMCAVCGCPKFICDCKNNSINYFDKLLTTNCSGKRENGVDYTSLSISTIPMTSLILPRVSARKACAILCPMKRPAILRCA